MTPRMKFRHSEAERRFNRRIYIGMLLFMVAGMILADTWGRQ